MHTAETRSPRTDAAETVARRLRRLLNEGMLALVAGMGSRAGWLDALAAVQPARVEVIARVAAADEPRVRDWLGALVAGGLVDHDGARGTYALVPDLAEFLARDEGRAYRRGLGALVTLATAVPRARVADAGGPAVREVVALIPGAAERLARGAEVLELRAHSIAALGIQAAFPASRVVTRARPPATHRGVFTLAFALDERALAAAAAASRLAAMLAPGGAVVVAVPALSDSPADDALHPVGAFLMGARALSAPARDAAAPPLDARLAAAGLVVRGLARVPSDPFRNYLIAHKPDSRNE